MPAPPAISKSRWQRSPVLIVGAHRSGTSATAEALEILGLQLGHRLDSHRECKALQNLHEKYLSRIGAAWSRPNPFLNWVQTPEGERDCSAYLKENVGANFREVLGYRRNPRGMWLWTRLKWGSAWGWKEPRTTLFGPLWLQLFPEARVIDVVRDPLAVALSIRERELKFREAGDSPKPELDDLDYCLRLALTYVAAGERLAACTPHYRRVRFEDIQENPATTIGQLAEFCGLRVASSRLRKAGATIRPAAAKSEHGLGPEAEALRTAYSTVAKLGY
jgi:hypothetical protein